MVKTQVQLPEHLYREGKRIAAEYEMSFADVVRRGLEQVIPSFPPRVRTTKNWALPELDLGLKDDPFADPEWREQINTDARTPRPRRARRST